MTREEREKYFHADAGGSVYRSAAVQGDPVAVGVGAVPGMGAVGNSVFCRRMGSNQEGGKEEWRKI